MTATYSYSAAPIWPLLATAALVVALGLYSWRRRQVPGAAYFAGACLLWFLLLAGIAAESVAVDPATRIAWHTYQALLQLPIATVVACFILEFVQPGRWLSRRNLALLALPPLLAGLLILTNPAHGLFWRELAVAAGVRVQPGPAGWVAVGYGLLLAAVQAMVLLWLFARSPQQRWPVALILWALLVTRGLFVLSVTDFPLALPFDTSLVMVFLPAAAYAVALFGFHIFDPAPAARQVVLEQMRTGMVVFDTGWRVVNLNPAAESLLGLRSAEARGKPWRTLTAAGQPLPDLTALGRAADPAGEFTLGSGASARRCAATLTPLHDFRGLAIGCLLLLRDVTEQRRAQAQILEQQRTLAALHEREQLGRDLHDSIGQVLGCASLQVEAARQLIDAGQPARAATQLARLAAVLQDAHADVREQILNLRAAPSPQQPLFTTVHHYLDSFTDNYDIVTRFQIGEELCDEALAPATQMQLFRILQEALSNARKHGGAHSVDVTFAACDGTLRMCIADDGCGFNPRAAAHGGSHYGLHFMDERAVELGGSLHIDSAPGAGARVAVEIPWKER